MRESTRARTLMVCHVLVHDHEYLLFHRVLEKSHTPVGPNSAAANRVVSHPCLYAPVICPLVTRESKNRAMKTEFQSKEVRIGEVYKPTDNYTIGHVCTLIRLTQTCGRLFSPLLPIRAWTHMNACLVIPTAVRVGF